MIAKMHLAKLNEALAPQDPLIWNDWLKQRRAVRPTLSPGLSELRFRSMRTVAWYELGGVKLYGAVLSDVSFNSGAGFSDRSGSVRTSCRWRTGGFPGTRRRRRSMRQSAVARHFRIGRGAAGELRKRCRIPLSAAESVPRGTEPTCSTASCAAGEADRTADDGHSQRAASTALEDNIRRGVRTSTSDRRG